MLWHTEIIVFIQKECPFNLSCLKTGWKFITQVVFMDVSVLINLERFSRIPRTRKESCEYLGLTSVTYAIQSRVLPLVETGQIKISIPEKPKSPKQLFYSE